MASRPQKALTIEVTENKDKRTGALLINVLILRDTWMASGPHKAFTWMERCLLSRDFEVGIESKEARRSAVNLVGGRWHHSLRPGD